MKACSICQRQFAGMGNNAQPVNDGRCCDECNREIVVRARIVITERKKFTPQQRFESDFGRYRGNPAQEGIDAVKADDAARDAARMTSKPMFTGRKMLGQKPRKI